MASSVPSNIGNDPANINISGNNVSNINPSNNNSNNNNTNNNNSIRRSSLPIETVIEDVYDGRTENPYKMTFSQRSMVGHGSFGYVYQISILPSNQKAAIKTVLQDKRFKNRELEIMKLLNHKNVVNLIAYYYKSNDKDELYLHLILEFVPETLHTASHWYFSKHKSMPSLAIKLYAYQLLRSLNYIHSLGICHRDIKPQNLLIDPIYGILKLCDFGSAKILKPSEPNVSYICSRYYRAPELIFGARNYTSKIDIWSAGCVIAEMVLGQPLFPGQSGIDQLVEIIKLLGTPSKDEIKSMNPNYMEHKFPSVRPIPLIKIFPTVEPEMVNLFIKIFSYSPTNRISAVEAMIEPYFDLFREENFQNTKLPNFRGYKLIDEIKVPNMLDFSKRELSLHPELWMKLLPEWKRKELGMSSFTPFSKLELQDTKNN
ncbi:regulator of ime2 [Pichia californica]|uniref:Regulator of ime2 n=1 Tax=Pichia californica TaxID=460514 RepID=A0A9P6WM12_9ASCO|nr:regulator of ime2 [[Candida] californica]KAG0689634.1 regulator of ime2 [[Candida] californica]